MTQPPPDRGPARGAPRPAGSIPPPGPLTPAYRDPRTRSPYLPGQEPIPPRRPRRGSPIVAPLLSAAGLVLVAGASLWMMGFLDATIGESSSSEPEAALAAADASLEPGSVEETLEPLPDVTLPPVEAPPSDERADVRGTILFTRSGDIWAASGTTLARLTSSSSDRSDAYPAWSPNGKQIYFIRTTKRTTDKSRPGGKYTFYTTDLMRMKADGSDRKRVFESLIKDSRGEWFSHVVQPSVHPNGNDVAVVSDGPDGSADEVTLHIINAKTGRLRRVATPSEPSLGHNSPDFSPDGSKIAFTYNDSKGSDGEPRIAIHTCQTKANCSLGKVKYFKPGHANPSWSPDGSLLAVESTDGTGRDIVLLNARRGDVIVPLTTDGASFAPVFSPAGDQIAYLHREGLGIDLRVMTLVVDEQGRITKVDDRPVTSDGGIDGISSPSWFIPADELDADDGDDVAVETETPSAEDDGAGGAAPPPPGS